MNFIKIFSVGFCINLLLNDVLLAEDIRVLYDDTKKLLSINAEDIPLQSLLGAIGRETGFEILVADDFNPDDKVSMNASGSVHQLIPRLVRGMSVVIYDGGKDKKSTVWILPQGADQSAYLNSGKSVRAIVVSGSDTAEALDKKERHRDIGREAWKLKQERKREIRKQRREREAENL